MDRVKLEAMVAEHKTLDQMSAELGKSMSCVRYWLKRYSIVRESNARTWTKDQMVEALKSSTTVSDALKQLGLQVRPGNYETVRRFVRMQGIDLSHMTGKACGRGSQRKSLDEVMIRESTYHRGSLKRRLMSLGILKNVCSVCGLSETWCDKPIVMVLDHINGDNCDHRRENLRMLCPNCNSQQETFCGKSKNKGVRVIPRSHRGRCSCGKLIWEESHQCSACAGIKCRRVARPSKEELVKMIETMPWTTIGKKFSVSDSAVRKWAKQYGII